MSLSRNQKNFIKKNLDRYSIDQLAKKLQLDYQTISDYINKTWPNRLKPKQGINEGKTVLKIGSWLIKDWQVLLFLAVTVFIVYANSLGNALVSDDIGSLVKDSRRGEFAYAIVQSALGFMRPLVLWVIYTLVHTTPWPYRLLNILFHLGSTFLVFKIVNKISDNKRLGFLSSILFATHPLLIEAVGWISGGTYSQYSFLLLFSFYFYLKLDQNSLKNWILTILFFLLTVTTSEKAVVFPIILAVYEFAFGRLKKNWKKVLPFVLLDFIWVGFYLSMYKVRAATLATEHYVQSGIDNPLIQIPIAISSYLELIFWPQRLTIYHSEMLFSPMVFMVRLIVFLAFLGLIALSYKKNRTIFFWLCFFLVSLIPTLTPLRISWTVAERYVYLGTLGILVPIAMGFDRLLKNEDFKLVVWFVFGIIILALGTRTIIRNVDWKNEDNLWLATAKYSPSSPNNHNNLGDVYARHGDLPKAAEEFSKAIQLKPNYADAYHNLGITYQRMGEFDKAEKNYLEALKYNPRLWQSCQNLSMINFERGNYQQARKYLEQGLAVSPNNESLLAIMANFEADGIGQE